jgi:hypothetical protein
MIDDVLEWVRKRIDGMRDRERKRCAIRLYLWRCGYQEEVQHCGRCRDINYQSLHRGRLEKSSK